MSKKNLRMRTGMIFIVSLLLIFVTGLKAQELQDQPSDTITPAVERLQSDMGLLKKLKVTGYIQFQYQKADTAGIESFAGGNFPSTASNRFGIRRGRIKFNYSNEFSQYVLQFDVTEKGFGIKDAYLTFTDPWISWFSVTGGAFNRPFGYEIAYSSSVRESPERSRFTQTLFPGERDLGAQLTIQAPKSSKWNFLKFEGGLFNGTGNNVVDFDKYKDFIGHISFSRTSKNEKIRYGGGFSIYAGGWRQGTKYNYKMESANLTGGGTMPAFKVDSTGKTGDQVKRQYFGIDGQLAFDTPLGITQIRGEYVWGQQPATAKTSTSLSAQPMADPSSLYSTTATIDTNGHITAVTVANKQVPMDACIRKFNAMYLYLTQTIGQSKHQLVLKYDMYDPNTDVKGDDIAANASKLPKGYKPTSSADIRYTTLGIGWIYKWNSNVKIMAYYDMVTNETTSAIKKGSTLADYSSDRKDNVFTLRVQYKF